MKLYSLNIEGFRRLLQTEVFFSDATFLIGQNNIGKSSILSALEYLLSDTKTIPESEYFQVYDSDGKTNQRLVDEIVFTAEFRNLPVEALTWRGFKGRVLKYDVPADSDETGLKVVYRKIFKLGQNVTVQLKFYKRVLKEIFSDCENLQSLIDAGLDRTIIEEIYPGANLNRKLTPTQRDRFNNIDELWDIDENEEEWFDNPGGIPGNVLEKLPRFLLIPAEDKTKEITDSSGTLKKTLGELFAVVRDSSDNYKKAQQYLKALADELDPTAEDSEFGKMMIDLNTVLGEVFPESKIYAKASLSDPDKSLKPDFDIQMFSNVLTPVSLQGMGMIRSAVFALLRYRKIFENKQKVEGKGHIRPLLIGFEEPEIYLHPNAANQMRDVIYDLASSEFNQIVCTTHSPFLIDLSQNPGQILNNLILDNTTINCNGNDIEVTKVKASPFNTSYAFNSLIADDKQQVKMLLKIDDYIARAFFAEKVLIIEGDTEDIVLRETIKRMPDIVRLDVLNRWQIIKARGKASIISLVKYLKAMDIHPFVLHDEDSETPGAVIFNQPIVDALGDSTQRIMLHNCIEDVLGYAPPSSEKPFKAYNHAENWGEWTQIPEAWRTIVTGIFKDSFDLLSSKEV